MNNTQKKSGFHVGEKIKRKEDKIYLPEKSAPPYILAGVLLDAKVSQVFFLCGFKPVNFS